MENNKSDKKSLLKNLPYIVIAPIIIPLLRLSQHQPNSLPYFIGYFLAYLILLTGLPILIVRIAKWLSKNKSWDQKATKAVWIIHIIFVVLPLFGELRLLLNS